MIRGSDEEAEAAGAGVSLGLWAPGGLSPLSDMARAEGKGRDERTAEKASLVRKLSEAAQWTLGNTDRPPPPTPFVTSVARAPTLYSSTTRGEFNGNSPAKVWRAVMT